MTTKNVRFTCCGAVETWTGDDVPDETTHGRCLPQPHISPFVRQWRPDDDEQAPRTATDKVIRLNADGTLMSTESKTEPGA